MTEVFKRTVGTMGNHGCKKGSVDNEVGHISYAAS
jgi:hypothetical protein